MFYEVLTLPLRKADFSEPLRNENLSQIMHGTHESNITELQDKADHLARVMSSALASPGAAASAGKPFADMCASLTPVRAMADECPDQDAALAMRTLCSLASKSASETLDALCSCFMQHCLSLLEVLPEGKSTISTPLALREMSILQSSGCSRMGDRRVTQI